MESVVKYLNLFAKNCRFGVKFHQTKEVNDLANVIFNVSPFAKTVIFSKEIKDANLIKSILNDFSQKGLKPIFYFINDNLNLIVENFAGAFNLPEDVRAVVILDEKSIPLGQYFANFMRVPCFYYLTEELPRGVLSDKMLLRVGDKFDTVNLRLERHVLIKENFNLEERTILSLISGLSVLADYTLNTVLGITPNSEKYYSIVKKSFINLSTVNNEDFVNTAVKCFFTLEFFNKALNSNPFMFSALEIFKMFYNDFIIGDEYFFAINKLLNKKIEQDFIPDYRKIAGEVCFKLNIGLLNAIDGIICQSKVFNGKIEQILPLIKGEFDCLIKLYDSLKKRVVGERNQKVDKSIYEKLFLTGSTPFGINAFSLVRELNFENL